MEIHLMFYNVSYANTDEALAANDGVLILAYMCEVILLEIKRNKTRTHTHTHARPHSLAHFAGVCFNLRVKNGLVRR